VKPKEVIANVLAPVGCVTYAWGAWLADDVANSGEKPAGSEQGPAWVIRSAGSIPGLASGYHAGGA
jgi:hypothetical protein